MAIGSKLRATDLVIGRGESGLYSSAMLNYMWNNLQTITTAASFGGGGVGFEDSDAVATTTQRTSLYAAIRMGNTNTQDAIQLPMRRGDFVVYGVDYQTMTHRMRVFYTGNRSALGTDGISFIADEESFTITGANIIAAPEGIISASQWNMPGRAGRFVEFELTDADQRAEVITVFGSQGNRVIGRLGQIGTGVETLSLMAITPDDTGTPVEMYSDDLTLYYGGFGRKKNPTVINISYI